MLRLNGTLIFIIHLILGVSSFIGTIMFGLLLEEILNKLFPKYKENNLAKARNPRKSYWYTQKSNTSIIRYSKPIWAVFWSSISVSIIFGALAAITSPIEKPNNSEKMTGDFRIAVGDFSFGDGISKDLAYDIGISTFNRINKSIIEENSSDLIFTVWSPDQVDLISTNDREERINNASVLANKISADVIVYGNIEKIGGYFSISPEFYVASHNFYEAEEILGQYYLGDPIEIANYEDVADRLLLTKKMDARLSGLSKIIIGLAYYSIRDYESAQNEFLSAESIENWEDNEGKHILYLMAGNASIKRDLFDLAERNYDRSLTIESGYSRALLGKANILYRRAINPIDTSNNPADLDMELINQALELIVQAETYNTQNPIKTIPPKIHFERGQIYFMMAYGEYLSDFNKAINEFSQVINEYEVENNPSIKERCAEAHARLGLIYQINREFELAVEEYEIAISLSENPERIKLFEDSLSKLKGNSSETVN